jgi:hypothetical protein
MAANRLGEIAESVHDASNTLRDDQENVLAHYADMLADRIDDFGRYVRSKNPSDLVDEVAGYARRHPEIVVTAGVVTGLLLGRFLKSSSERRQIESRFDRDSEFDRDRSFDRDEWAENRPRLESSPRAGMNRPGRGVIPASGMSAQSSGFSAPASSRGPGVPPPATPGAVPPPGANAGASMARPSTPGTPRSDGPGTRPGQRTGGE